MAKDQKGHGSNKRGMARVSVNRPVGYTVHGVGPGGKKTLLKSGVFSPEVAREFAKRIGAGAEHMTDTAAAKQLSSGGPKSTPAPVHEAMTEHGVRYQPGVTGGALSLHAAYGTGWKKYDKGQK